jgi:hypothetical protein
MNGYKDNIKTDLKGIGREDMGWIHLTQGRVQWQVIVNMAANLQSP